MVQLVHLALMLPRGNAYALPLRVYLLTYVNLWPLLDEFVLAMLIPVVCLPLSHAVLLPWIRPIGIGEIA